MKEAHEERGRRPVAGRLPSQTMTEESQTLSLSEAESLVCNALRASGVVEACAASVARALVAAEAEGQVGHGFLRLSDYVSQVQSDKVRAEAVPKCR